MSTERRVGPAPTDGERQCRARAAASVITPAYKRASSRERDAPPNPVWGAPVGTIAIVPKPDPVPVPVPVPVEPPAPAALPVRPVDPEPPGGVAAPVEVVVVVPDPVFPVPPVAAATKSSTNVVVQVTVLPPPLDEPLH